MFARKSGVHIQSGTQTHRGILLLLRLGGSVMPHSHGEGKALSILVCTLPSHILFVTAFVYTSCAISSEFHHLQGRMRTSSSLRRELRGILTEST